MTPLACLSPQVVIREEIAETPTFQADLDNAVQSFPPAYANHPIVQSSLPRKAIPLALYLYGIGFAKRDSILGVPH